MIFAVCPDTTFEYVPESDRDSENPTAFSLRTLTIRELTKIEDKVTRVSQNENTEEVTISVFTGTQSLESLRAGLRGWKNFCDAKGNEIEFVADKKGIPKDETLSLIPADIRQELSSEILSRSRVTESERKN